MSPVVIARRRKQTRKQISRSALAKLKSEVVRIGANGTRQGFKFAEKMFGLYPELRQS